MIMFLRSHHGNLSCLSALLIVRSNAVDGTCRAGPGAEQCAARATRAGRAARRIPLQLSAGFVLCGGQGQGRAGGGDHGRVVRRSTPVYNQP